jgi:hypothetical protein
MALPLGEQGNQHIGSRHLFAARTLDVDRRPLQDALEACGRFGIIGPVGDQVGQFVVEIFDQLGAELLEIHTTGPEDGDGVLVFGQGQKEVFKGGVLVAALVGEGQGSMERLLEVTRQHG